MQRRSKNRESIMPASQEIFPYGLKSIQKVIRNQHNLLNQQFYDRIPFYCGYGAIFIIILIFFAKGAVLTSHQNQMMIQQFEKQSQDCLLKYSQKKCQINDKTQQCQSYLQCLKRRNEGVSMFSWISHTITSTLKGISEQATGFVNLAVAAMLIKIIHVITTHIKQKAQ